MYVFVFFKKWMMERKEKEKKLGFFLGENKNKKAKIEESKSIVPSCIFSAAQYFIGIMGSYPMHEAPTFRGLGEVIGRQH